MKQFISSGLGAAPILALFAFAAIQVSSCGSGGSKGGPIEAAQLSGHIILTANDSSLGGGSGTGGHPLLIVTCVNLECPLLHLNSTTPVAVGTDSVDYVIEAKTTGAIPANTTLRMEIRVRKDSAFR